MPKSGISKPLGLGGGNVIREIINHSYTSLISLTNLFQAWEQFKNGKSNKRDVQLFERHLEDNLFDLYFTLKTKNYKHGGYFEFYVNDPKRRHIHKAEVSDRIVHHLAYSYLYPLFDKTFIHDSYSCRLNKGTHKAVKRLEKYARIVSRNYTQDCWVLKLDIKQFFASVDHEILAKIIIRKVKDENIFWLINEILASFRTDKDRGVGIPLGNLTSQIFANIYLNELDQFIKHNLKIKYYIRYADDFLILNSERLQLKPHLIAVGNFLVSSLRLQLHPKKIILRKSKRGIDFCGYVVLPQYLLPRTKTKSRIMKNFAIRHISNESFQSYLGYFSHARSHKITQHLKNLFFLK